MTEHKMVLTGTWPRTYSHGSGHRRGQTQGNGLTVRCTCMADEQGRQVPYAYDYLAQVTTIEDAKYVYAEHLRTGATLITVEEKL